MMEWTIAWSRLEGIDMHLLQTIGVQLSIEGMQLVHTTDLIAQQPTMKVQKSTVCYNFRLEDSTNSKFVTLL